MKYNQMALAGHQNFGNKNYPNKPEAIEQFRTEQKRIIFLDDHPKNCSDVKDVYPESHVYLMNRPHNESLLDQDWKRVFNWDEFILQVQTYSET